MKLPIRVSEESREPIYHQIETQVKALIVSGQLPSGTPLPSIRAMSNELACSVITTRRAYQNLETCSFIKTVQGKGTFVKEVEGLRKEETKQKVVYDAFVKAFEHAERMGCSVEDMQKVFNVVIHNKTSGG
ncbi:GntR family transcriptional regulator [Halalkalibacter lacteus]|uniref:GntR family transcriptional regulator n=1 Tax=Halalkalibacter lacteus TaxID=3090663 RepID=UPI002FC64468